MTYEQVTRHEVYDVSESESEEEDAVPLPIGSPAPSETSSITASENEEHILAIEADSRRVKAYKIAMELLTTERSYVAVLRLIDQVSVVETVGRNVDQHVSVCSLIDRWNCVCELFRSQLVERRI